MVSHWTVLSTLISSSPLHGSESGENQHIDGCDTGVMTTSTERTFTVDNPHNFSFLRFLLTVVLGDSNFLHSTVGLRTLPTIYVRDIRFSRSRPSGPNVLPVSGDDSPG